MARKGKTHSGAKKRFKVTATGKIMRRKANRNHLLQKKSSKRKRALGQGAVVDKTDHERIAKLLQMG